MDNKLFFGIKPQILSKKLGVFCCAHTRSIASKTRVVVVVNQFDVKAGKSYRKKKAGKAIFRPSI